MNKLLKDLYDCFYTPPELAATKREIEECHRALIEALGKPERRLVLKIIDAKDHISEDTSLDSFISGFRLAWRLYTAAHRAKQAVITAVTMRFFIVHHPPF